MKYCPKCGTELADDNAYCSKCGAWQYVETQGKQEPASQQNPPEPKPPYHNTVATLNRILLMLECVSLFLTVLAAIVCTTLSATWLEEIKHMLQDLEQEYGGAISSVYWMFANFGVVGIWMKALPLAWTVPMTLNYIKKSKANEPTTLAFKICTLIFVNVLVGILMLCFEQHADKHEEHNDQFRERI